MRKLKVAMIEVFGRIRPDFIFKMKLPNSFNKNTLNAIANYDTSSAITTYIELLVFNNDIPN